MVSVHHTDKPRQEACAHPVDLGVKRIGHDDLGVFSDPGKGLVQPRFHERVAQHFGIPRSSEPAHDAALRRLGGGEARSGGGLWQEGGNGFKADNSGNFFDQCREVVQVRPPGGRRHTPRLSRRLHVAADIFQNRLRALRRDLDSCHTEN